MIKKGVLGADVYSQMYNMGQKGENKNKQITVI